MFTAVKGVLEGYGYELITLAGAGHEVRILPQQGFNLYYWTFEGAQVLMEPEDIAVYGTKYGIPILFPTPNRTKDATYVWQGETHVMTRGGEKVQRHGFVHNQPFTVTKLSADGDSAVCEAEITLREADGGFSGYPFPCTLRVRYTLSAAGVRMDATILNEGDRVMPFGFALHPYFSKRGDANQAFIKVPAERCYETDDDLIATGRIFPAKEGQIIHDGFHSVESLSLDTGYRGLTQDKVSIVRYADIDVLIRASDCFRNAIVYTPHSRPGFCIEPQTNATNFLNLFAEGLVDESGLLALPAGKAFRCWVDFTIQKR